MEIFLIVVCVLVGIALLPYVLSALIILGTFGLAILVAIGAFVQELLKARKRK